MMSHENEIEEIWRAYLSSLPEDRDPPAGYQAWSFGDDPAMADELADLVVRGIKTATASLLWAYEAEAEEGPPQPGEMSVILDGGGLPVCIIETTEVEVKPFNQVEAAFAYDEGEGDRSLAYWRAVHWRFFSRECGSIGRTPSETMPVVCERFRVVHRYVPIETVLETPRCRLRYPALADAPRMHAALRDPSFPRRVPLGQVRSLEEVQAWIQRGQAAWAQGLVYPWAVEDRETGVLVGQVTLSRRTQPDCWALAFWTHPECWGGGYATEAAQRVVTFGFERLGAATIWAGAATWNGASLRVLEKLGMRHVADNPQGYFIDGEGIATCEFEMSREAWQDSSVGWYDEVNQDLERLP